MPIHGDLLGLRRRSMQLGEIRMGTSVEIPGKKGRRPVRHDTFRLTTASEMAAIAVAEKFGGQVAPWTQRRGRFEVLTDRTAIDVWVPPRGEAVDSSMEMWDGPRRRRKCDGHKMLFPVPGQPCMCPLPDNPADPDQVRATKDERDRLAKLRTPEACKVLTRINVTIPDLPGLLGVWKLITGSESAAVETADQGQIMEIAREGGRYLPAVLRMEWRWRPEDGSPYQVPVLHIGMTTRELAEGGLAAVGPAGLLDQLRPPKEFLALPSGEPAPEPADDAGLEPWVRATAIYARAQAATTRAEVEECFALAQERGLVGESVHTGLDQDATAEYTDLQPALRALWVQKGTAA
ncbi:MAG TPA: hypothetical protein VK586_03630 [Streptosporangiaceae bacterium]|nr:hypothetical protein [Streptosporangiaceae bacterium]